MGNEYGKSGRLSIFFSGLHFLHLIKDLIACSLGPCSSEFLKVVTLLNNAFNNAFEEHFFEGFIFTLYHRHGYHVGLSSLDLF